MEYKDNFVVYIHQFLENKIEWKIIRMHRKFQNV